MSCLRADFPTSKLEALRANLRAENFEPYFTSVGGSGLGILSPYDHGAGAPAHTNFFTGPITPPETPSELADGAAEEKPLREQFSIVDPAKLGDWADKQGRWLYV